MKLNIRNLAHDMTHALRILHLNFYFSVNFKDIQKYPNKASVDTLKEVQAIRTFAEDMKDF